MPKFKRESLNNDIGIHFRAEVENGFLDNFIGETSERKYRLLAAVKDLLKRFIYDTKELDTENKANLANFLLQNHKAFLKDIIEEFFTKDDRDSFISKIQAAVEEVISLRSSSSTGSSKVSTDSSINIADIAKEIGKICENSIELATARHKSENRTLTDLIPEGKVAKQSNEKNLKVESMKTIHMIQNKRRSINTKYSSSDGDSLFSDIVILPKNLYDKVRQNNLKSKSLITQLTGISTVTMSAAEAAIRENKKLENWTHRFNRKLLTKLKYTEWVDSIAKFTVKETPKVFDSLFNSLFSDFGYSRFNDLYVYLTDFFWKWSKKYTLSLISFVSRKSLFYSIPLLDGSKIKDMLKTSKIANLFPAMGALKAFLGKFFSWTWTFYKFVYTNAFNLIKRLTRLVSNPIKKIISFFIKVMKSPWVFIYLGYVTGKILTAFVDRMMTGNYDVFLGRTVTDEMSRLERIGSNGPLSYIQKELDAISKIFEALSDFFQTNTRYKDSETLKQVNSFMGYKDISNDSNSSEIIEEKKMQSNFYDFTFSSAIFIHNWFFNGENSLFKKYLRQGMDFIKEQYVALIDKLNLNYLLAKDNETFEKGFLDLNFTIGNIEEGIEDTINSVLQFLNMLVGKMGTAHGTRAGVKIGGMLGSKIPGNLITKSMGGLAGGIAGGYLGGIAGKSIEQSLLKSLIGDIKYKSNTDKATDFINKVEREHRSIGEITVGNEILKNLSNGASNIKSMFSDIKVNDSNASEVESAKTFERELITEASKSTVHLMYNNLNNSGITRKEGEKNENISIDKFLDEMLAKKNLKINPETLQFTNEKRKSCTGIGKEIKYLKNEYFANNNPLKLKIPKFDYSKDDVINGQVIAGHVSYPETLDVKEYNQAFTKYYNNMIVNLFKQGKISFRTLINLYNEPDTNMAMIFLSKTFVDPWRDVVNRRVHDFNGKNILKQLESKNVGEETFGWLWWKKITEKGLDTSFQEEFAEKYFVTPKNSMTDTEQQTFVNGIFSSIENIGNFEQMAYERAYQRFSEVIRIYSSNTNVGKDWIVNHKDGFKNMAKIFLIQASNETSFDKIVDFSMSSGSFTFNYESFVRKFNDFSLSAQRNALEFTKNDDKVLSAINDLEEVFNRPMISEEDIDLRIKYLDEILSSSNGYAYNNTSSEQIKKDSNAVDSTEVTQL